MSLVIPNLNNTNNKTIKQLFNLNYQFMNSKLKIIVTLLSIGLGNFVTAQTLNGKYTTKIKNNLQSNFQSAKSLLEDNTDYSGKTILLLTPSFPISF
jgi:nucleoside recognition membrane protein YjiH